MENIRIRKIAEQDFPALHALLSDAEVMRFLEPPFSPDRTRVFLRDAGLCDPPRVYAAETDGQFIGYVIFHPYDETGMEIGWVLQRAQWGKGYACVLTAQLLERCRTMGKQAVLECVPEQNASRHIAEKFGLTYEGISDGLCVYRLREC